jgi:hypothetical protein
MLGQAVRLLFLTNKDVVVVVRSDPIPDIHFCTGVIAVVIDDINRAVAMSYTHRATSISMPTAVSVIERVIGKRWVLRIPLERLEG